MCSLALTPKEKVEVEMLCAAFYGSMDDDALIKTKMFTDAAYSLSSLVDSIARRGMLHGPDGIATRIKKELTAHNIVNPKYAKY